MADFSTTVGNGNGVMVCLSDIQKTNALYSAAYKAILDEQTNSGLPGAVASTAMSQGVFENTADNLKYFYQMLQENIKRTAPSTYQVNKNFFTNTTLSQGNVLAMMYGGATTINDFLTHPDTVALNVVTDAALLDSLI